MRGSRERYQVIVGGSGMLQRIFQIAKGGRDILGLFVVSPSVERGSELAHGLANGTRVLRALEK